MKPPKITWRKSPNFTRGRKGQKPEMIVCHITDGGYSGAVSWLCNKDSKASAHYVVSDKGEITQLVDLRNAAWANGTSVTPNTKHFYGVSTLEKVKEKKTNANYYTISIEHEGYYNKTHGALTDAQLKATAGLIKYIRQQVKKEFGVDIPMNRQGIVGHNEISPITRPNCPGEDFPYSKIIEVLNNETLL